MGFKQKKKRPAKVVMSCAKANENHYELGPEQTEALRQLKNFWESDAEFYLLKGYAGTGKSTLCSVFINDLPQANIRLCASTNKAASVLEEKCREASLKVTVTTIHKLLKLVPQQIGDHWKLRQVDEPHLESIDLIIIDECSMIGEDVWNFLQDLPFRYQLKILCMGDPAQLPPINETTSPCFNIPHYSELTEIFRQAKGHPILEYSLKIRQALENPSLPIPLPQPDEGIQIFQNTASWLASLKNDYQKPGAKTKLDHLQILTWTNHRVDKWNEWIQQHIYLKKHGPFSTDQFLTLTSPLIKGGWKSSRQIIMPNNEVVKVISTRQIEWRGLDLWQLDIRNLIGEIATILYIPPEQQEVFDQQCLAWERESNHKIAMRQQIENWKSQCVGIQPSASLTTHRSQGSSFKIVYLDLPSILSCHKREECLQLLYVATTRATRELNVLIPAASSGT
jgi:ATP-dependent exoDNAse (exonuclease V) alpha subunit